MITSNHAGVLPKLLQDLGRSLFAMKDLGPIHYFLGIEAHWLPLDLYLPQMKHVWDLLHKTKMHDAIPIKSLVQLGSKLSKADGAPISNPQEYHSVVDVQYARLIRPKIAFAINKVCQFMDDPQTLHWMAVKRILQFLKGTKHMAFVFTNGPLTTSKRPTDIYYLL